MWNTKSALSSDSKLAWRFIFYRVPEEIGEIRSNTSKKLRDDMFGTCYCHRCLGSHGAFEDFPWDKIGEKTMKNGHFFKGKIEVIFNGKKFPSNVWGFQKYIFCNPWAKRIFNLCPTHGTIWPWCPDRSCKNHQVLENTVRGTLWDHWGLSSFNIVLVRSFGR